MSAPSTALTNRSAATGRQFRIARGGSGAVVAELAATLRSFEMGAVLLTETFGDGDIPPGATGITLAPWANRIEAGRWTLDGKVQQLDITEPSRGNASHGLLRNTGYTVLDAADDRVSLEAVVFPQHGYPFLVRHRVDYAIDDDGGLRVRQTLANDSSRPAPFVLGAHPYLRLGDVPTGDLTLTVHASTRLVADERLIPRETAPAEGEWDLSAGRTVADLAIDAAYTDLAFGPAFPSDAGSSGERARARATLTAPDGRSVWLWQDERCRYTHVFVTRTFPGREVAVALEPQTGPADAFNSGIDLGWIDPGKEASMEWGIGASL
ncbi:aldose 1-epimerase family protein [Sinomonas sp. JGH33]|uniref:Aldose 1-epimerase family protein n=1 Tax=Sinomonas terricola TaxID=3110330 RepID=A0ABU5T961_9MICC|nr:aldose 1-epimerase family protein [Sinomonas sp. JGH33]MEA5456228.1 aldose 1-epimerase family protein [Sinomonas sp. JGH33]